MANSYLGSISTKRTSQREPIPGADQVRNEAGGFVYEVDEWTRLDRFLILGSENGDFYVGERKLTAQNVANLAAVVKADGTRVVETIVVISDEGRAVRNTEALFALAYAASKGDVLTRRAAMDALPQVARTGTHLFQFLGFAKQFRGWGRAMKRGVQAWYERDLSQVAYQMVKYRDREGYTHRDALRLAKPTPEWGSARARLFAWAVGKMDVEAEGIPEIVVGYEKMRAAKSAEYAASLIREYNLPREAVPTELTTDVEVQAALLERMPPTALIRNLANMTRSGLLAPMSDASNDVVAKLADGEWLRRARVHPIAILLALKTYASGHGLRGSNTWQPVGQIIDALDGAFYETLAQIEPSDKRLLIALDVSGSMTIHNVAGIPNLSAREASAAMAMALMRSYPKHEVIGFTDGTKGNRYIRRDAVVPIALTPKQRLDDAVRTVHDLAYGRTDCALPFLYAEHFNRQYDAVITLTDNETWFGAIHPSQALESYRNKSGLATKFVAAALTATSYSIADPNDGGSMNVAGLDASVPKVLDDFVG